MVGPHHPSRGGPWLAQSPPWLADMMREENLSIVVLSVLVVMLYIAAYWWVPVTCPPGHVDGDDRICTPLAERR